jgi:Conjugal transfer protein TrbH.
MKTLALVACLILAGCETLSGFKAKSSGSYVTVELTQAENETVARDMSWFLAGQLAYAKTTIALAPVKTEFNRALAEELARRGFGVADGVTPPGAVSVHYAISAMGDGVVARMRFQGKEASRYYTATEHGLQRGGRYSLRGAFK